MKLHLSTRKAAPIQRGMIGLFFEDINYAADGGLYAEMIENRSFEFVDCFGTVGDYYTKPDWGYGWRATEDNGQGQMEYVTGSPVNRINPHYLRFTAGEAGQGFWNKAYDGIYLEEGKQYRVSFYARAAAYPEGDLEVSVRKDGRICALATVTCIHAPAGSWQKWHRYEAELTACETVRGGRFTISLTAAGAVEFDLISMMPKDAVAGLFRRDLFELLKGLHPGFLRFPGGCIIEGNTLENRYRWKESVGPVEQRRFNFNRWAVHGTAEENGWHTRYSHYGQTLGLGYYEYFLLCEMIGAKPLPVLNVGLACQYQSYELVEMDDPAFQEFLQDAVDLIEFANGPADSKWGAVRAQMGHPEPFGLTMVGIGNEQWQTDKIDFFARYKAFEETIHAQYPDILLIGSAGPDITSERYRMAWDFYKKEVPAKKNFCYAVDEHYYVKPEWFYEHTDFYDEYPRDVKVFSGEYAAHPVSGMNLPQANTLGGALAEAAFLTGVERNADVVVLASYAPLFARVGYAQWSPDMIWFDETKAYGTPSYYVQKLYGENMGTVTVDMEGQEKQLRSEDVYVNVSLDEEKGELIIKAVNHSAAGKTLELDFGAWKAEGAMRQQILAGQEDDYNCIEKPDKVVLREKESDVSQGLFLEPDSFTVARIPVRA
ncbi:MAG: alpha-L-arabinofuranosidase C-terminal domain-containing protein [Eubacteriales bacterium]|nr:alpha-L-arabinofuranosidase C-terminal domain-containing protein [Eubacteriales bacterium]